MSEKETLLISSINNLERRLALSSTFKADDEKTKRTLLEARRETLLLLLEKQDNLLIDYYERYKERCTISI